MYFPCCMRPGRFRALALVLLLFACALPARATVYYISQSQGSDLNPGTTQAQPWKSLARLLQVSLKPGDEVRLRRGDVWRETLIVRESGTANAPIRYTSYGAGALPVIDGTDTYNSIDILGGGLFRVTTVQPAEVLVINGAAGRRVQSQAQLVANRDWVFQNGAVIFRAPSKPASVDIATRQFGIVMNLVRHVHFDSLAVRFASDPVWIYNANDCRFELMRVTHSAGFACFFFAADTPGYGSRNVVSECIMEYQRGNSGSLSFENNGCGIMVYGTGFSDENIFQGNLVNDMGHEGIGIINGSRSVIRGNSVSGCASAGIRLVGESASDNVIERNEVFGNCHSQDDRFGIDLLIVGSDNIVRYNYVHDQEQVPAGPYKSGGIRFDGGDFSMEQNQTSRGNKAYYNLVTNEFIGINCFNVSHVDIINNTVMDCESYAIVIHAVSNLVPEGNRAINNVVRMQTNGIFYEGAVAGTVIDYNFYQGGLGTYFASNGLPYTFSTWRSVLGFDLHGQQAPLLLVNPEQLDFRPTANSPAVDAGLDMGLPMDYLGVPLPQGGAVDAGAFELVQLPMPEGEGEPEGDGEPEGEGEVEGEGTGDGEGEGTLDGEGGVDGEGIADGEGDGDGDGEGTIDGEGTLDGEGTIDGEGAVEGTLDGEGTEDGEGVTEGEGAMDGEGAAEGEGTIDGERDIDGEGVADGEGTADGEGSIEGGVDGEGMEEEGSLDGEGVAEEEGAVDGEGSVDGEGAADGEGSIDGEGAAEGEGAADGEGLIDGEGATDGEGSIDGEGSAEGSPDGAVEGEGQEDGEGGVDGEVVDGEDEGALDGEVTEGEGSVDGEGEGAVDGESEGVVEGAADGEGATEGVVEGEVEEGEGAEEGNVDEGEDDEGEGELEGGGEGEGEGEGGVVTRYHTADRNQDLVINLSELLRVVQLYREGGLRCNPFAEDGYDAGVAPRDCTPHSADYLPQDWRIRHVELLRVVQLYNADGYLPDDAGEDGFAPVSPY